MASDRPVDTKLLRLAHWANVRTLYNGDETAPGGGLARKTIPRLPGVLDRRGPAGSCDSHGLRPYILCRLHKAAEGVTWSGDSPEGRWRSYSYEELIKRDKINMDLFWLQEKSLEDSDSLPDPDVIAAEIVDDLQAALDGFAAIIAELGQ